MEKYTIVIKKNTEAEKMEIRKNIEDLISSMDKKIESRGNCKTAYFISGKNTTYENGMLIPFAIWHIIEYIHETS